MALRLRLPHPLVLLVGFVVAAAVLTWVVPAGEYERRDDPATGRQVVVPGTYHAVEPTPVSLPEALVSIPSKNLVVPLERLEAEPRFRREVLYWKDRTTSY